jgi:hypothetical protein
METIAGSVMPDGRDVSRSLRYSHVQFVQYCASRVNMRSGFLRVGSGLCLAEAVQGVSRS